MNLKHISSFILDESIFQNNKVLFNYRNRAITNLNVFLSIIVLFLIEIIAYLFIYEYSKSYQFINVVNIVMLISMMITEIFMVIILRKSLHIISMLSIVIYFK